MELWVSVEKGEYDGGLGSDTQQAGEECPLGKGLRAVIEKSRWSDSNRRPAVYKTAALPLSYIGTRTVYHRWSRCAPKTIAAGAFHFLHSRVNPPARAMNSAYEAHNRNVQRKRWQTLDQICMVNRESFWSLQQAPCHGELLSLPMLCARNVGKPLAGPNRP